jgi:hypothetical protein
VACCALGAGQTKDAATVRFRDAQSDPGLARSLVHSLSKDLMELSLERNTTSRRSLGFSRWFTSVLSPPQSVLCCLMHSSRDREVLKVQRQRMSLFPSSATQEDSGGD